MYSIRVSKHQSGVNGVCFQAKSITGEAKDEDDQDLKQRLQEISVSDHDSGVGGDEALGEEENGVPKLNC